MQYNTHQPAFTATLLAVCFCVKPQVFEEENENPKTGLLGGTHMSHEAIPGAESVASNKARSIS